MTFEAITRRPVITSQWRPGMNADIEHIAIADGIDLLLVAPCTANVIGKFANGIADDFLSSLYLATRAPVLLAPAMNSNMLAHEAVQRNLQTLGCARRPLRRAGRGLPGVRLDRQGTARRARCHRRCGRLCAAVAGRLAPSWPARARVTRADLRGHRSGAVSSATDRAAGWDSRLRRGARGAARVTLVAGPTRVEPPPVDEVVRVRSAAEMHEAVMHRAASPTSSSWPPRWPITRRRPHGRKRSRRRTRR